MFSRSVRKSARQPRLTLSIEWLEDRRLLSVSLLGAAAPMQAPALSAVPAAITSPAISPIVQSVQNLAASIPAPSMSLSPIVENAVAQAPALAAPLSSAVDTVTQVVADVVQLPA